MPAVARGEFSLFVFVVAGIHCSRSAEGDAKTKNADDNGNQIGSPKKR